MIESKSPLQNQKRIKVERGADHMHSTLHPKKGQIGDQQNLAIGFLLQKRCHELCILLSQTL